MEKLTAIVPTFNEEAHIVQVLQSVQFADEIIVVDSFSTDKTPELARPMCTRFVQHAYENSAAQKNWIIPQATHDWILIVDADERVTPDLQQEIQLLLATSQQKSAFWIRRRNHFMGREIKYSGWQTDKVIRLFRKSMCQYEPKHVHAEVINQGETGMLQNRLLHYTYKNFDDYYFKLNRYATWSAYDKMGNNKNIGILQLALKPCWRFVRHYLLQGGFLDGKQGFIIAVLMGWSVFLRSLKMWRMQQGEHFGDAISKTR